jgi:hypothetical protein
MSRWAQSDLCGCASKSLYLLLLWSGADGPVCSPGNSTHVRGGVFVCPLPFCLPLQCTDSPNSENVPSWKYRGCAFGICMLFFTACFVSIRYIRMFRACSHVNLNSLLNLNRLDLECGCGLFGLLSTERCVVLSANLCCTVYGSFYRGVQYTRLARILDVSLVGFLSHAAQSWFDTMVIPKKTSMF